MNKMFFMKPTENGLGGKSLYVTSFEELKLSIGFRSLNLSTDVNIIHKWANSPYAKRFWQLEGSKEFITTTYQTILQSKDAHSFIIMHDDRPVGLVDVYRIYLSELANYCNASEYDCGIHFLMCPPSERSKNLSLHSLKAFQDFYFSFNEPDALWGEPDVNNALVTQMVKKAGFTILKQVELVGKTANLCRLTRDEFEFRQSKHQTI